jgi:hypothetical protein
MKLQRNTREPQSHGNLRTSINAKQDSFILKFPPEIASHIFFLSMDTPFHDVSKKLPMPLLLGSVCRGWRLLARSTPVLWSMLSFSLAKPTRKPEGLSQLNAVSNWLQLSGDVPLILTLAVFKYLEADSVSQEECDAVIDLLNQHSGRWGNLLLYMPASLFLRFCGTSPPSRLCEIHLIGNCHELPTFKMRSRPSPTHLTIVHFPISTVDIKWNNLTFLKMTLPVLDGCIEAIQQAPLLETCSITLSSTEFLPFIPKTTLRHLCLRTLKLVNFPVGILCSFLDALDLPALQAYHHLTLDMRDDISADNMISLLNRSRIDLKQLTLNAYSLRVEDLKKLLNAVPWLQNLQLGVQSIANAPVIRELFEHLYSSPPSIGDIPGVLPSLQSLTISGCKISIWGCIPHLFSSPHRKLLRLEVNERNEIDIDNDTFRTIVRLVDEGFNIRIHWAGLDYLQRFEEKSREADLSVDLALEGGPVKADDKKEGFLASFSTFISCLFCRG